MADQSVKMEFSGDEAKLMLAIKRIVRGQDKMTAAARRTARGTRTAARAGRSFTDSLSLGKLSLITGGIASIATAWRLVGDEVRFVFDRMQKIAEMAKARAVEFLPAISALPVQIAELGPQWLDRAIAKAQKAGPVLQPELLKGVQAIGSVAGAIKPETFEELLKVSARLSATTRPEETALFGAAIQKVSTLADLGENVKAAAGLLFQLGTAMPIATMGEQATNLPRALAKVLPFEPTMEDAAEYLTVAAQYTLDPTARLSGTQAAGIAKKIRTAGLFPTGRGGKMMPLTDEEREGKSTLELLELVRDRLEAEKADFHRVQQTISLITESTAGTSFVQAVFSRDPRVVAETAQARRAISPIETPADVTAMERTFEERIRRAEARPEVQALLAEREVAVGIEQLAKAQPEVGRKGIVLKQLEEFQKVAPQGTAMGTRFRKLRALADTDVDDTINRALELVEEFKKPTKIISPPSAQRVGLLSAILGVGAAPREDARSPEFIAALETIGRGFEKMLDVGKQQLDAARETEKSIKKIANGTNGTRPPQPAGGFDVEQ